MGLAILGDIMLGRHQAPLVKRYGLNKILSQLLPIIEDRKIIANLECPLVEVKSSKKNNKLSKLSAKEECAEDLSNSGFTALSLGNNHIFDFGIEGLINTQALLNKNSINIVFYILAVAYYNLGNFKYCSKFLHECNKITSNQINVLYLMSLICFTNKAYEEVIIQTEPFKMHSYKDLVYNLFTKTDNIIFKLNH